MSSRSFARFCARQSKSGVIRGRQPLRTNTPACVLQGVSSSACYSSQPNSILTPEGKAAAEPTSKVLAQRFRERASVTAETYIAYGGTETLYAECARQAHYIVPQAGQKNAKVPTNDKGEDVGVGEGWWYEELKLTPTFNTWAQITFLHMYLLTVRFRMLRPQFVRTWNQNLLDHFFTDAENRMITNHNISVRGVRNRYLKDLFIQWRGLQAAYDEGLVKGDPVLAMAVWRNIFKATDDVDFVALAQIVSYIRRNIKDLANIEAFDLESGKVRFNSPSEDLNLVQTKSSLLDQPVKADERLEIGGKAP